MRLALIACGLLLLTSCNEDTGSTSSNQGFKQLLAPCTQTVNVAIQGLVSDSYCGTVRVFENRATKQGRKIDLNVMVIPAIATHPNPDPIFFLAGGPGQAAVSVGPYLIRQIPIWRQDRDIVLVDQRGTGKSNSLACESGDGSEQLDLTEAAEEVEYDLLKKCLADLDADTRLYTTQIAMDDLDEVRQYLGYDQINLIGVSYGTRAGLVYIRRHENHVRSAVLDAVVPLSMAIPEHVAPDAEHAFGLMIRDCKQQLACNSSYPHLQQHYERLVDRLKKVKTLIDITNPMSGKQRTIHLDYHIINRLVRSVLYDRTLSRLLPIAIEQAYDENYTPLTTLVQLLFNPDQAISTGMMASVLCAEDMRQLTSVKTTAHFENPLFDTLAQVCKFWPTTAVDPSYFEPVKSNVPVLLTSGSLDPITPPKYALQALQTLSNAEHIIVPGAGHGSSTVGCMPDVVKRFIDTASIENLNSNCSVNIRRLAFLNSYAGVLEPEATTTSSAND